MADNTVTQHPDAQAEREKYVSAFNETMLRIWREQMTLGIIDTGRLLASPKSLPVRADGRFIEVGLSQSFLEYGLWQDFGTGKEIPRGNHGDIGREKGGNRDVDNIVGGHQRVAKKWFSRKYYASVMNIRDFMADFTSFSKKLEFTSVLLYQGFLALDPTTPDVRRGK